VVIEVIGKREFAALVDDFPEIGRTLMAAMAQRLAEIDGER
jgi:hypothetical protein